MGLAFSISLEEVKVATIQTLIDNRMIFNLKLLKEDTI